MTGRRRRQRHGRRNAHDAIRFRSARVCPGHECGACGGGGALVSSAAAALLLHTSVARQDGYRSVARERDTVRAPRYVSATDSHARDRAFVPLSLPRRELASRTPPPPTPPRSSRRSPTRRPTVTDQRCAPAPSRRGRRQRDTARETPPPPRGTGVRTTEGGRGASGPRRRLRPLSRDTRGRHPGTGGRPRAHTGRLRSRCHCSARDNGRPPPIFICIRYILCSPSSRISLHSHVYNTFHRRPKRNPRRWDFTHETRFLSRC